MAPRGVAVRTPSPRLARIRRDVLNAPYTVCVAKARYTAEAITRREPLSVRALKAVHGKLYKRGLEQAARGQSTGAAASLINGGMVRLYEALGLPRLTVASAAEALSHTLASTPLRVWPGELLVGNPSTHRVGAPVHPDYGGLLLDSELDGIAERATNPLAISDSDRRLLKGPIFQAWFHRSVLAWTPLYSHDPELPRILAEGKDMVLTQIAGISHVTPDYQAVLLHGLDGLARKTRAALRKPGRVAAQGPFLRSCLTVLRAASAHAKRWRATAQALAAAEVEPGRRAELNQIAETLEQVPHRPARTFREALQAIVLTHCMLHYESFQHGISFGRLDQILWPYLEADLREKTITHEDATELLGCFLIKAAELVPLFFNRATEYFSGLSSASGITLGGRTASGADATNPCSFAILRAYDQVRLRQPNIHVRVHPGLDPAFLDLCHSVLARGGGMPAFFNDARIEDALVEAGSSPARARGYAVVGCAEWGIPGCSFPAAGAGFVNLASALDLALRGGRRDGRQVGPVTPPPAALTSMAPITEALRVQLSALVERAARGNNAIERAHAACRPTPMLSTLIDGCLESGRDVTAGGARVNSAGLQGVGLADVADSLATLEALLARDPASVPGMVAALDANFVGHERLLAFARNAVPKFGNDGGRAEHWAQVASTLYCRLVRAQWLPRGGGTYLPGFWTMTTHQGFGKRTGALPSGRLAGAALANGASPGTGLDRMGPTAALTSAAQVAPPGNGLVINQTLNPTFLAGHGGPDLIRGLVRGYFKQGGLQLQINVLDPAVLREAKKNPHLHNDLVVRISGYSAYFNDLTDAMKEELIARASKEALS